MTDPRDDLPASAHFDPVVTDAVLENSPALIGLWGYSNSGKTYSALRLARGLVGEDGKIGMIDTENRRAKFYANDFAFKHIDLQPPFSSERYLACYEKLVAVGCACIITDSFSHCWEGEGGVLEQADANPGKGLLTWKLPKTRYNKMRAKFMRSPVHMIFCLRAKDQVVQLPDKSIVSKGDVPIADRRFIYEMTVSCHMEIGACKPLTVKIPAGMVDALRPGEYISEEAGRKIANWLAGGKEVDQRTLQVQNEARDVAVMGRSFMEKHWKALSRDDRARLLPIKSELASIADEADRADEPTITGIINNANTGSALDDEFTTKL